MEEFTSGTLEKARSSENERKQGELTGWVSYEKFIEVESRGAHRRKHIAAYDTIGPQRVLERRASARGDDERAPARRRLPECTDLPPQIIRKAHERGRDDALHP